MNNMQRARIRQAIKHIGVAKQLIGVTDDELLDEFGGVEKWTQEHKLTEARYEKLEERKHQIASQGEKLENEQNYLNENIERMQLLIGDK